MHISECQPYLKIFWAIQFSVFSPFEWKSREHGEIPKQKHSPLQEEACRKNEIIGKLKDPNWKFFHGERVYLTPRTHVTPITKKSSVKPP